jgi:CheY-like chemotaxis protein
MSESIKRILVVDDDELLRDFYSRVLTSQGYVPICASNGEEAISILEGEDQPFDLALVDLLLPVKSGWELIEHIRASSRFAKLPIIAITGLAFTFEEFEKVKSTCDGVLMKGEFEITKFTETVARLLGD